MFSRLNFDSAFYPFLLIRKIRPFLLEKVVIMQSDICCWFYAPTYAKWLPLNRSSRRRCYVKKVFLKILQYSQENTSVLESLFNKAAGLKAWCFLMNSEKFLRITFLQTNSGWLLLNLLNVASNETIIIIKKSI